MELRCICRSQERGTVGADVGCGNGKYLGLNSKVQMIGCDRSSSLIGICAERGFEVFVADGLSLPLRSHSFVILIQCGISVILSSL